MASLLVDLQPASNLSLSRRMNMAADGAGGGWLDVRQARVHRPGSDAARWVPSWVCECLRERGLGKLGWAVMGGRCSQQYVQ
jgi:hypothetical protein